MVKTGCLSVVLRWSNSGQKRRSNGGKRRAGLQRSSAARQSQSASPKMGRSRRASLPADTGTAAKQWSKCGQKWSKVAKVVTNLKCSSRGCDALADRDRHKWSKRVESCAADGRVGRLRWQPNPSWRRARMAAMSRGLCVSQHAGGLRSNGGENLWSNGGQNLWSNGGHRDRSSGRSVPASRARASLARMPTASLRVLCVCARSAITALLICKLE